MFSLEQKHLADAQVAEIVARLRAEGKIAPLSERIAKDLALLDGVDDDFANAIGEDYIDWSPDPEYPTTTFGWIRWYGPVRWLRVRYRMWLFWRLWHRKE